MVTAAVQVTGARIHRARTPPPRWGSNPKTSELAIVTTDIRTKRTCDVYISINGGRSWFPGVALPSSRLPTAAASPSAASSSRSSSNAAARPTWPSPPTTRSSQIEVTRRSRGTSSWRALKPLAAAGRPRPSSRRHLPPTPARPTIRARWWLGPGGAIHAVIPERGFAKPQSEEPLVRPLNHRRSSDHGKTWSEPVEVDQGNAGFSFARKWGLAADPNSATLYVVWYGHPDPRASRPEDDHDIYLRVSTTDGGDTWSDPERVNDDQRENVQHYDPNMAIAPNGRLDIAWLDFRNSPVPEGDAEGPPFNHGGFQDVYYSSSSDQGRTLTPNLRITDRWIDRTIGVWSNNVHSHTRPLVCPRPLIRSTSPGRTPGTVTRRNRPRTYSSPR